jgi:hypothetical protein
MRTGYFGTILKLTISATTAAATSRRDPDLVLGSRRSEQVHRAVRELSR